MNLANSFTFLRIFLAPFFLWCLISRSFLFAFILFVFAVFTDFLDGRIARTYGVVTDFGKFLDPVADKILVTSALLYFVWSNLINVVPVAILLFREFVVTAVRLSACQKGKILAANNLGKIKTVLQVISILLAIFYLYYASNFLLNSNLTKNLLFCSKFFLWLAAVFSLVSGVVYVRDLLKLD